MKRLIEKLKNPTPLICVLSIIITVVTASLALTLVILNKSQSILAYASYALAALSLAYSVFVIIMFAPKLKESIIVALKKNKFTADILENFGYRKLVFAIWSFIFNVLYALFQAVIAVLSRSVWYGALAVYYIVLTVIRGQVVNKSAKQRKLDEQESLSMQYTTYRNCGFYLVALNFALTAAVVQMVVKDMSFAYAGLMIYAMAAYAFLKLTLVIISVVKADKANDYMVKSINSISFADSLVSILALQTALLQTFGGGVGSQLFNSLTGGAVCIIIIALGVFMAIKGNKLLREKGTYNGRKM